VGRDPATRTERTSNERTRGRPRGTKGAGRRPQGSKQAR
jgi:hypothetical protein